MLNYEAKFKFKKKKKRKEFVVIIMELVTRSNFKHLFLVPNLKDTSFPCLLVSLLLVRSHPSSFLLKESFGCQHYLLIANWWWNNSPKLKLYIIRLVESAMKIWGKCKKMEESAGRTNSARGYHVLRYIKDEILWVMRVCFVLSKNNSFPFLTNPLWFLLPSHVMLLSLCKKIGSVSTDPPLCRIKPSVICHPPLYIYILFNRLHTFFFS